MMDINDIKNHINNKSRLIGVDMGSKRVGLSISDENRKSSKFPHANTRFAHGVAARD